MLRLGRLDSAPQVGPKGVPLWREHPKQVLQGVIAGWNIRDQRCRVDIQRRPAETGLRRVWRAASGGV